MDLTERNDPETQYSDKPGTRAMTKGSGTLIAAIVVGVQAFVLASFGLLPALLLLVVAIPLGMWGSRKVKANETQLPGAEQGDRRS